MDRLDTQVDDYRELQKQLPYVDSRVIGQIVLAVSVERAADRIAQSIDDLEIVIRTKKPEGL